METSDWIVKNELGSSVAIKRDSYGRPNLSNAEGFISISHTSNYIAVLLNDNRPIALDIEKRTRNAEKIASKFTTPDETKAIQVIFAENPLIASWTAKEALFKILHTEGVLFRDHLCFTDGEKLNDLIKLRWKISHPEKTGLVHTKSFIFDELLVTYIDDPIEHI